MFQILYTYNLPNNFIVFLLMFDKFNIIVEKVSLLSSWCQDKPLDQDKLDFIASITDPLVSSAPSISQAFWTYINSKTLDKLEAKILKLNFNACAYCFTVARDNGCLMPSWNSFINHTMASNNEIALTQLDILGKTLINELKNKSSISKEILLENNITNFDAWWNKKIHNQYIKPFCHMQIKSLDDFILET